MELDGIKLSKSLIKLIVVEALRGKSLYRTLLDYSLSEIEVSGKILDLGSKSDSVGSIRYLKFKDPFSITYSDYYRVAKNLIKINLEEPFKIEQNSYDYVTCFNTLEHIYNYKNVIIESYRILRRGGVFIGSTPFIIQFHPDPYDYFRYSHQALLKMFEEEYFSCRKMVRFGFGPFSIAVFQWMDLMPRVLRPIFLLSGVSLDVVLSKFTKSYEVRYPFGYVYAFEKT